MTAHTLRLVALLSILGTFHANLWAQTPDSQSPQRKVSLQDYISTLDQSSTVLAEKDPAKIHKFRMSLPREWDVQAGRQNFSVNTGWLEVALGAAEIHPQTNDVLVENAKRRLALLREAAEGFSGSVPDERVTARAREQLGRILSDREFQGASGPSAFDILKARAYAWISTWLGKLFGRVAQSPAISNAIVWILIAVSVLLLAYWAVSSTIRTGPQPQLGLRGVSTQGRNWRAWLREARAAAERGDHRAAIRAAYWAGVKRLEDTHRLPEVRSLTPRESLRLVKGDNAVYKPFSQLTHRFELIRYGNRPATSADWVDAVHQLEALGCLGSSIPAIAGS